MKVSQKILLNTTLAVTVLSIGSAALAADAAAPTKQGATAAADPQKPTSKGKTFSGNVSWYGPGFDGRLTASGERFNMMKLTAAHLKLPFNTKVLVEDPRTGNTVLVRVNDRGPYHAKRVMDLSKGGATKLGTISHGVSFVDCMILEDAAKKKG